MAQCSKIASGKENSGNLLVSPGVLCYLGLVESLVLSQSSSMVQFCWRRIAGHREYDLGGIGNPLSSDKHEDQE